MTLKVLRSWTISSVYFVMLLQKFGKCMELAPPESEVNNFPLEDGSVKAETKLQDFGQSKAECTQGLFHTKPEFSDGSIFKPPFGTILETVYGITNVATCVAIDIGANLILGTSPEKFCDCNCYYEHGASGSEYCKSPDFPCKCIYTQNDLLKNHKHRPDGPIPISNSTTLQGTTNATSGIQTKPGNLRADVCKTVLETPLLCRPIDDGGNPFYTVGSNKIFPEDVCSIDCFYIHGARKAPGPYGQCCEKNGATRCFCLY